MKMKCRHCGRPHDPYSTCCICELPAYWRRAASEMARAAEKRREQANAIEAELLADKQYPIAEVPRW